MIDAQRRIRFTGFVVTVYSSIAFLALFAGNGSFIQRFQHNWLVVLLFVIFTPSLRRLTLRMTSKFTESTEVSPFWLKITSPSASMRLLMIIFLGGALVFVVSLPGYIEGTQPRWLTFTEGLGVLLGTSGMGFVADVWRTRNGRRSSQNR